MIGQLEWDPALFGYTLGAADDPTFDERDSAPFMPKCGRGRPGLQLAQGAAAACRGSTRSSTRRMCAASRKLPSGAARAAARHVRRPGHAEIIDYLKSLGVTTVELLPVHTFVDDSHLLDKGLTNYWGYNSIGFFAPDPRYAANADFAFAEFKEMVAHLHDAGLEVILDVVYNHTAEGNELGPTLSFKGIDNASYYRLMPDTPRYYINDTGTGNTAEPQPPAACCRW